MNDTIKVFHTGFDIIETPDLKRGRANADFGQGFYVSSDEAFSRRWARYRKGQTTCINSYALDLNGLKIRRFQRDEDWFSYLFDNRHHKEDRYQDYDLIIGPIANDTIYDTFGIITSGILDREQAMELLLLGKEYRQIVLKTPKSLEQLSFLSYEQISEEEICSYRALVLKEQEEYQRQFTERMKEF